MPHRIRKSTSIAAKATELAIAVPQVIAHRVTRMAIADPKLSQRDRKEFHRMGTEKIAAFSESWIAMMMQAALANQQLAASFIRLFWSPWLWMLGSNSSSNSTSSQLHNATLGVFAKGIAPVHRTAVANAKRLARTKLR